MIQHLLRRSAELGSNHAGQPRHRLVWCRRSEDKPPSVRPPIGARALRLPRDPSMNTALERRLAALERRHAASGRRRVVWWNEGEPEPQAEPGEHLTIVSWTWRDEEISTVSAPASGAEGQVSLGKGRGSGPKCTAEEEPPMTSATARANARLLEVDCAGTMPGPSVGSSEQSGGLRPKRT
jgi:hypothetical protein